MIGANITNARRKYVYKRDHYACVLCDDNRRLQIHHVRPRSVGGNNSSRNLVTLCPSCHALAHGTQLSLDWQAGTTREDVEQALIEYIDDLYAAADEAARKASEDFYQMLEDNDLHPDKAQIPI